MQVFAKSLVAQVALLSVSNWEAQGSNSPPPTIKLSSIKKEKKKIASVSKNEQVQIYLCLKIINYISNCALFWQSYSMNHNLDRSGPNVLAWINYKFSVCKNLISILTSSLVAWWNATFRVFKPCNSGRGMSNTS